MKRFIPRSLFGRAALILVVPVVGIQLLVSIAFIQRHFEGVTRQMTASIVLELQLLEEVIAGQGLEAGQDFGAALALGVEAAQPPPRVDARDFWDFSGRVIAKTLRERLTTIQAVDLVSERRMVILRMETSAGLLDIAIDRRRVSASNPHQLLVLMVFASLVLTFIAYIFLRNQIRPIRRLADAAEAFGKGRVLPYRPQGASEVRAAGAAFLDMRARIERQIEQRTLMLSGISHDLRTPLTRMRLALAMMEPGAEAEALREDIATMERMVDGFLAFVRGDATERPVSCDPRSLAAQAVEGARRAGRAVVLVDGAPCPPVSLRPDAVARALDNLVGNATRHAERCEVQVIDEGHHVTFRIEDDGPGIPAHRREEALRAFTRLDEARDPNRGGGIGLGLAIASEIAHSHGGRLVLDTSARLGGLQADLILAR